MNKIYELYSDFENYAHFREDYRGADNSFSSRYWGRKNIKHKRYKSVKTILLNSDKGHKNYNFDISTSILGLIIFSNKAVDILRDILEPRGQFIPIETDGKKHRFQGFYPNKNIYDLSIVNLERSHYTQYDNGNKMFYKVVLNENYPKDDYLFVIKGIELTTFVTDKFKDLIEKNKLKGFDFSREIEVRIEREEI